MMTTYDYAIETAALAILAREPFQEFIDAAIEEQDGCVGTCWVKRPVIRLVLTDIFERVAALFEEDMAPHLDADTVAKVEAPPPRGPYRHCRSLRGAELTRSMGKIPKGNVSDLIERALALLAEAGVLEPLLTTTEAAALACVTDETIRAWLREDETLGRYSRQLRCFLVSLPELRRVVLKKRGMLSIALRQSDRSQIQDVLILAPPKGSTTDAERPQTDKSARRQRRDDVEAPARQARPKPAGSPGRARQGARARSQASS
jgi:hypothetical protein